MEGGIMADLRASGLGGIPKGATADRPASPSIGDLFYDGTLGFLLIYDGVKWLPCSAPAAQPTIVASDIGTNRAYGSGSVSVAFTEGDSGGKAAGFTAYTASGTTYTQTSISTPVTLVVGNSGTYSIAGTAYNGFGTSPASLPSSVAVTTVPEAPTIGTASTITSSTDISLTWSLNNNGGKSLTSIIITPYLNGVTAQTPINASSASATSHTITGLTQNSSYTFKVKAVNANGSSLESSASNSITVPTAINIDYVVLAGGGGGGGRYMGGGGGAGGFIYSTSYSTTVGSVLTAVVGGGGAGGGEGTRGSNGIDSSFAVTTALGGGGGGSWESTGGGRTGGSGGGNAGYTQSRGSAPFDARGTAGQGNDGGLGVTYGAGGGGGAGGAGSNGQNTDNGGPGGAGISNSITGSAVFYGGGGGGGSYNSSYVALGGSSIGGNGAPGPATTNGGGTPTSASQNRGSGGGGANGYGGGGSSTPHMTGGNGSSGIVIVRSSKVATATTGSPSYSNPSTGVHVYQFLNNGTITI